MEIEQIRIFDIVNTRSKAKIALYSQNGILQSQNGILYAQNGIFLDVDFINNFDID